MSYTVKDYGTWTPYTPDPLPEWAQGVITLGGTVVFLRREDGKDFYDLRNSEPFAEGAVLAATMPNPATGLETVKSVFRDPTMMFPAAQRLIEIGGVDPSISDPHNLFTDKVFDPVKQTFSDPPPFTPTACSKLGLKRAFDELGQWSAVKAAIAADPAAQEDWELATVVSRTDPLTQKLQRALHLTDDQVSQLLRRAVALVQPTP